MDFPDPKPSREEMIETYLKTLAIVVGSYEEAKKRMYAFSTTTYIGFQAVMDEEMTENFRGLPGVLFVLPDAYLGYTKEYGGDKYDNGVITMARPRYPYWGKSSRPDKNSNPQPSSESTGFAMVLDRYGAVRIRFTWRNRFVNKSTPKTSQKVLADCKDQRGHGGKYTYFSFCTPLEAHQRLKVDEPCAELSWEDLENKSRALYKEIYSVLRCQTVLKDTGVCYKDSEETLKIKDYEEINTSVADVSRAVKNYMKDGPMIGVFEVFGSIFDHYGKPKDKSNFFDDIYVVNPHQGGRWTHTVTITGFGVQGKYPFWEFQNSYGPLWRGAARGFGQIYAVHLYSLYGFTLA